MMSGLVVHSLAFTLKKKTERMLLKWMLSFFAFLDPQCLDAKGVIF